MNGLSEPEDEDDALVRRAGRGDTNAFALLIPRYQARVTRFACRLLGGDRAAAEDVAQEVFLRLWRNAATYESRGNLQAYLLRVTRNLCLDARRRTDPTHPLDTCREMPDGRAGVEEAVHGRTLAEAVRHAVAALPDGQREALILHQYEGMGYREIAEILDCPPGTVASRIHLARAALRRCLHPHITDTDPEGETDR
jgi:RNA polymerase sigma-70 factor (ECF subfamily)